MGPQLHSASARGSARPGELVGVPQVSTWKIWKRQAALPKDGEDGCRFGSDVSCFGMFWKSLIFLDGHIVTQNTIEHTNQIKPVTQPVQARLRSSSTMAAIPEAGRPSLCANQSYVGTACLIIMSRPWTHCTCFELVSV